MDEPVKLLKGQLLLDGGSLAGSFFSRTVVLMCQHNEEGAFGLVLNRSMDKPIGEMLVEDLPEQLAEQDLWVGVPVQPSALSYLLSDYFLPDANVMPNLSLEHSIEDLAELGDSFSPTQKIRVFAGYSGWAPGQLEDEMKRNAWITHPANLDHVFAMEPEKLWRSVMIELGGIHRLMADGPDDLSLN